MIDFTPDHKKSDRLIYCPFPKHKHKKWKWVKENDPDYIYWLISSDGPEMDESFLEFLQDMIEDLEDDFDEYDDDDWGDEADWLDD